MTNEETINNNDPVSKEETAIINAAFRLHEIVIQHRIYRRRSGRTQFTANSLVQARKALADLQPSVRGTNPIKVASILAQNQNVARASIKLALEQAKAARTATWDSIRNTELTADGMKDMSEEGPLFNLFTQAARLDHYIRELGRDYLVARVAHLASTLASTVDQELRTASTKAEAA